MCKTCGLNDKSISKIVDFIEKDFFSFIAKNENYLPPNVTGLNYAVEYDPATGLYFIHLNQVIGRGGQKVVTRSVLYGIEKPQVVATAASQSQSEINNEIEIARKLQHIPHVLHVIASPANSHQGRVMYEMITEYYDQGSLKDPGKQESLTMKEKVDIAKDLMEALKDVHAAGYIHGDTHSGNLLLERNQDRSLRDVRYRLVVIDWGTASPISPATDFYRKKGPI